MAVPLVEHHHPHDRSTKAHDLGWLLVGVGAVLLGLTALLFFLWLALSTVKATPFDSDGVRCFRAATELACIQTTQPPR